MRLFQERGYDETTVADIAAAADIAPRTFFSYFPTKADLLLSDSEVRLALLRRRLENRSADEATFDVLLAWVFETSQNGDVLDEREKLITRLIAHNRPLAARDREMMGRFELLLGESLATDLNEPSCSLRVRMVAAAATAALMFVRDVGTEASDDELLEQLNAAVTFLRAGIATLASGTVGAAGAS